MECEVRSVPAGAQNEHSGRFQAVNLKLCASFATLHRCLLFPVVHADRMHARRLATCNVAGTITDHTGALHVQTELVESLKEKERLGFSVTTRLTIPLSYTM